MTTTKDFPLQTSHTDFSPPRLLRNTHAQSLLASAGPRKYLSTRRARNVTDSAQEVILDCGDEVRLQGFYSPHGGKSGNKLVILLHGWLGNESSSYLLSAAATLYAEGFDVFRLNLRDHGDTHHLNAELFHSARLAEVINAMSEIQRLYPHDHYYLCGFSLGGNFALRVSAEHNQGNAQFDSIVAICPVINPQSAMATISKAMWLYPWYFVQKWKRSLRKKLAHFPQLDFGAELARAKSLDDLNNFFVPNHTPYQQLTDYFKAYSVAGERLARIKVPTHIIHAADDPVVSAGDLQQASRDGRLSIEITHRGGHCGFLKNYRLHSWVDDRLLDLFGE
ncbi:MAG: alpha/beta fold hydrolase [Pseudomonadota bacterium]